MTKKTKEPEIKPAKPKTYEYNFGFYDVLNSKKLKGFSKTEASTSANLINGQRSLTDTNQKHILKLEKQNENLLEEKSNIIFLCADCHLNKPIPKKNRKGILRRFRN